MSKGERGVKLKALQALERRILAQQTFIKQASYGSRGSTLQCYLFLKFLAEATAAAVYRNEKSQQKQLNDVPVRRKKKR